MSYNKRYNGPTHQWGWPLIIGEVGVVKIKNNKHLYMYFLNVMWDTV